MAGIYWDFQFGLKTVEAAEETVEAELEVVDMHVARLEVEVEVEVEGQHSPQPHLYHRTGGLFRH